MNTNMFKTKGSFLEQVEGLIKESGIDEKLILMPSEKIFWTEKEIITTIEAKLNQYFKKENQQQDIETFLEFLKEINKNNSIKSKEQYEILNQNNIIGKITSRFLDYQTAKGIELFLQIYPHIESFMSEFSKERTKKEYNKLLIHFPHDKILPNPKYLKFSESMSIIKTIYNYPSEQAYEYVVNFGKKFPLVFIDLFPKEITSKVLIILGKLRLPSEEIDLEALFKPTNVYKDLPYFPFLSKNKKELREEVVKEISNFNCNKYKRVLIEYDLLKSIKEEDKEIETKYKQTREKLKIIKDQLYSEFEEKYKDEIPFVFNHIDELKLHDVKILEEVVPLKEALQIISINTKKQKEKTKLNIKEILKSSNERIKNKELIVLDHVLYQEKIE